MFWRLCCQQIIYLMYIIFQIICKAVNYYLVKKKIIYFNSKTAI